MKPSLTAQARRIEGLGAQLMGIFLDHSGIVLVLAQASPASTLEGDYQMNRRTILIIAALIVVASGWYLFRPERLFVNARINEEFPAPGNGTPAAAVASQVTLAEGRFHDVAHKSVGTATIHQLSDGKRVLRLTNFETSNGPDVHVYMVAAEDATDNDTVTRAGFVELGSLKGNIGDQNYDLPAETDLSKYRAVTIWCRRFGVNFATAPLMPRS